MNAARKKRLNDALDIIREVKDEEETAHGNLPDQFQFGEQGDKMQEAIDSMDNAISELENITNV